MLTLLIAWLGACSAPDRAPAADAGVSNDAALYPCQRRPDIGPAPDGDVVILLEPAGGWCDMGAE